MLHSHPRCLILNEAITTPLSMLILYEGGDIFVSILPDRGWQIMGGKTTVRITGKFL